MRPKAGDAKEGVGGTFGREGGGGGGGSELLKDAGFKMNFTTSSPMSALSATAVPHHFLAKLFHFIQLPPSNRPLLSINRSTGKRTSPTVQQLVLTDPALRVKYCSVGHFYVEM